MPGQVSRRSPARLPRPGQADGAPLARDGAARQPADRSRRYRDLLARTGFLNNSSIAEAGCAALGHSQSRSVRGGHARLQLPTRALLRRSPAHGTSRSPWATSYRPTDATHRHHHHTRRSIGLRRSGRRRALILLCSGERNVPVEPGTSGNNGRVCPVATSTRESTPARHKSKPFSPISMTRCTQSGSA